jgi:hypothetical protein
MKIEDTLYFDNNGYSLKEYAYKLDLFNIISNKTTTFTGLVTISSTRIFSITNDFSGLIKGQYKGNLYLDTVLCSTFLGITDFNDLENYTYDKEESKFIYEG